MIASYFLFPKNFFCTKKIRIFTRAFRQTRANDSTKFKIRKEEFHLLSQKALNVGGIEIRNRVIKMEHSKS